MVESPTNEREEYGDKKQKREWEGKCIWTGNADLYTRSKWGPPKNLKF